VADDALIRARKALAAPKSGAVVPADRSGRDLIALAKTASQRPGGPAAPAVNETKSASRLPALVQRVREAAAKPVPVRAKPPDPPKVEALPKAVPAQVSPAPVPAPTTHVPVEIAPGQTVPVEIPQNAPAGAPINIVVNVQNNEQRGWGPYWPYPYLHGCRAPACPHWRGLPCTGWFCRW
jgi:hypothetical protein